MENTKACTTDTISSNSPNKVPETHIKYWSLHTKDNKICPALILANNRKHKVTGRTEILINSTTLKKDAKYQGEFKGKREDKDLTFTKNIIILTNQNNKAILKLKLKVVVTG